MRLSQIILLLLFVAAPTLKGEDNQTNNLLATIDRKVDEIEEKTIRWRRHFHQYPELSNQEFETAKIIAEHLYNLGLDVQTGIAKTGVTGLLVGGKPGPVVAIRADMDALPVTEEVDLPFASQVKTVYNGRETGVSHVCGHDAHMAILMATAEVLASVKDELPGSVKFIFQPAEEGAGDAEIWGAELMIREGILQNPSPEVIFGLHVMPYPSGSIRYNPDALMASVDNFRIVVRGRGTHGAKPWSGIDPIVMGSAIVMNLQSLVSRKVEHTEGAAVVTVGSFHGGNRNNIIPDEVEMLGTIRTHNDESKQLIHQRIREVVEQTAASFGASANVNLDILYPVTVNHADICDMMLPSLEKAAVDGDVKVINPIMAAEDFSFFLNEIPGMFFFLGTRPDGLEDHQVEFNHSPRFAINESALKTGVRAFSYMVLDYARLKGY